jgi:regulator of replication initiation timing
LFYAIIDDDDNEMAPEDVVSELTHLRAENTRLNTALQAALNFAKAQTAVYAGIAGIDDAQELIDNHLSLQTENARLAAQLQAMSDQLTDAVQRAREAERERDEAREALRLIADTSGETHIWQIATGAMVNSTLDN